MSDFLVIAAYLGPVERPKPTGPDPGTGETRDPAG